MVPDLVLICENMLMAEGFQTAKSLASKFYGLYSLLASLLSKQLHYDWGLRAVKSVLVVAGGFKRAEPDLQEEELLMRALRDFNIPKIVQEDSAIFFGLLGDLFPGIDPPRKVDEDLEEDVLNACTELGLWPDDEFRLKVVQLEELLAIRHCVFVMGPASCGKSNAWKTLSKARTMRGQKTKVMDINPKSVSTEELYGYIMMSTREWKDGLLSKIMRDLGCLCLCPSLSRSVCVYIYTYICLCMHMSLYIYIYTLSRSVYHCLYIYVYMSLYIHIYVFVHHHCLDLCVCINK
jgi:dynein heavy chain